MALSIQNAANRTIYLLEKSGIKVPNAEREQFRALGFGNVCGFNCKIANVLGSSSFRLVVSRGWFRSSANKSKPSIRTSANGFDFQLLPTQAHLFAIYYLALRDYARLLEEDRERWFAEAWWGAEVNIFKGLFVWKGGNTIQFPLTVLSSPIDLDLRERQYRQCPEAFPTT